MSTYDIELTEEELDLTLEALSFQFKYNYSNEVESLMEKIEKSKDKEFEIYKTMVASTGHVEAGDLEDLASFPEIFSLHDHHYGTRLFLGSDVVSEIGQVPISDGLKMLILFATSTGCRYLELDADGPEYEGFPKYVW
jgi:hypothetical protein